MTTNNWLMRGVCIATMVFAGTVAANAQLVYSNDFETNTNGFNSSSTATLETTSTPIGSGGAASTYLGRFSNDTIKLTLTGLTAGATYNVGFDLFIGASWDGNLTSFGPDMWKFTADGNVQVDTTFLNLSGDQNYSDTNPIGAGANAAFTGADVFFSAGGTFGNYAIYYFGHGAGNPAPSFVASSSTVDLIFEGSNLQGVNDEFWAIDNVTVRGTSTVPEPGSVALLIGGLSAGAFMLRRRR